MKSFEIEQKYRCKNLSAVRKKLIALKSRLINQGFEQNELWDLNGKLINAKSVLRLRRHGRTVELAFKGPRLKSKYTKRIELQTTVEYAPMKAILTALGYRVARQYSKKREVYQLGKVMVTLDTLPRLGTFIELEGAERDITLAAKKLGVTDKDREERSYLAMLFKPRS